MSAEQGEGRNASEEPPRPYATGFQFYLDAGWAVVLPVDDKGETPAKMTGYNGPLSIPREKYGFWASTKGDWNLTLRLPPDVVGLDFDAYKSEAALRACQDFESRWALPPTHRSSSRFGSGYDNLSGIRLYRLPPKFAARADMQEWNSNIDGAIDVIRYAHRQCVAWPSIHQKRGTLYRWLDETTGELLVEGRVPHYEDIPMLSEEFVAAVLRKPEQRRKKRRSKAFDQPQDVQVESEHLTEGRPCRAVQTQLDRALASVKAGTRYDDMVGHQVALVRLGEQGHRGTRDALERYASRYVEVLTDERNASGEWNRAIAGVDAEIAAGGRTTDADKGCCNDQGGSRALRDQLLDLALDRFDLGRTIDDVPFVVDRCGPNVALMHSVAKKQLASLQYETTGSAPGRTPRDEGWEVIEARCSLVEKTDLPMRVAWHEGQVVLDLGTADGRAVVVGPDTVNIVDRSPVTFQRTAATLPLPPPSESPSWDGLWRAVNVSEHDRDIVKSFLRCALLPHIPHPIAQIVGNMGSAKTTASRYISSVLDPGDVMKPPRDEGAWVSRVSARWMIPMDNVSKIDPWWSDLLCQTATGSADVARKLYTDNDAVLKTLRGCVILNGISLGSALRSDLAERLLPIELERPKEYRTEVQVRAEFDACHADVLSALLHDMAKILAVRGQVRFDTSLRMADFVQLMAEADHVTGEQACGRYAILHREAADTALESDAVAQAILNLMCGTSSWTGTASELLEAITIDGITAGTQWWEKKGVWSPTTPSGLSGALKRSEPLLQNAGISVMRHRGGKGKRTLELSWLDGE